MTSQPMLGRFCRWCNEPAVDSILIEPAQYKTVGMRNPETGAMVYAPQVVKFAISADVCEHHRGVRDREGGTPLPDFRRRKAKDVVQLDIFDAHVEHQPNNAIKGE